MYQLLHDKFIKNISISEEEFEFLKNFSSQEITEKTIFIAGRRCSKVYGFCK